MAKRIVFYVCGILILCSVAPAIGYPGQTYYPAVIGESVIDGVISGAEWDSAVWIDMDFAFGAPEVNDLSDAKWAAMWSPNTNLLYVAVTGRDTNHNFSTDFINWNRHDDLEVYVDAGNTDTQNAAYYSGTQRWAQNYFIGADGNDSAWSYIPNQSADNVIPPGGYAVSVNGDIITYECALRPYLDLNLSNPGSSIVRTLAPGQTVGLDVCMYTSDGNNASFLAGNAAMPKWSDAGTLLDVTLLDVVYVNKGDLTRDGFVDIDDLAVMAGNWLKNDLIADIAPVVGDGSVSMADGDGIVNGRDLALLAQNWQDESWMLSSNTLDFCYRQTLQTEADFYGAYGTKKYPYQTCDNCSVWPSTPGYQLWDTNHYRNGPDYVEGWTVGFFPGCLWYMYELTGETFIKDQAQLWTERLENQKYNTVFADQGFALLCSFGQGHRLTGDPDYRDVAVQGAYSLASRYDPNVGCIDSWDWGGYIDKFTVIIDTMMNLEILFYGAKHTGDPNLYEIAVDHAYKTRDYFVREDGSACNIITFDPNTGEPNDYDCDPCQPWSRGQAWAVYGFTMAYRETGDPNFLVTAQACADYFIDNLPADKVPPKYFNTAEAKDSSASAIAASGLLELCVLVSDPPKQQKYYNAAKEILLSLARPYSTGGYLADDDDACILRQSNAQTRGFIYGDYYFIEALMRYYKLTAYAE